MFKYLNRRIVALVALVLVLALMIFSRTTEMFSRDKEEAGANADGEVELILPPYIEGAVTRRAYDDLPDIDIDSWEYLLVNQAHNCGAYAPDVEQIEGTSSYFEVRAIDKLYALLDAAHKAGFDPHVYVGYRAYVIQADQYRAQVAQLVNKGYSQADAEREAAEISSEPGTSEHQTGLCIDLVDRYTESLTDYQMDPTFEAWLNDHVAEFGFIMRYPENKVSVTGRYEPWHIRYVGEEAAQFMTTHNLTLEEFVTLYH